MQAVRRGLHLERVEIERRRLVLHDEQVPRVGALLRLRRLGRFRIDVDDVRCDPPVAVAELADPLTNPRRVLRRAAEVVTDRWPLAMLLDWEHAADRREMHAERNARLDRRGLEVLGAKIVETARA